MGDEGFTVGIPVSGFAGWDTIAGLIGYFEDAPTASPIAAWAKSGPQPVVKP